MTALSPAVRAFLDRPNYAVLCTLNPDGSPQASMMWVGRDGDDLLFSTVAGRRKERNMRRDPRVTVVVSDRADPEVYVEVRGTATISEEGGRELDDALSWKYDGKAAGADAPGAVRVVVRITPTKVLGRVA